MNEETEREPMKAVDPVCGMDVEQARAAAAIRYAGQTFHFCSAECAQKFRADPSRYTVSYVELE